MVTADVDVCVGGAGRRLGQGPFQVEAASLARSKGKRYVATEPCNATLRIVSVRASENGVKERTPEMARFGVKA